MNATEIEIRPLSPILGAEVRGVDTSVPLAGDVKKRLRDAWHEHSLLLFRGQTLDEDEQLRFATTFGQIAKQHHAVTGLNYVSNTMEGGNNPYGGLGFHFDHSFMPVPLRGLMLYAIEAPPEGAGGDTLFVNMKLAYKSVPQALRERIEGTIIRHGVPDKTTSEALPKLADVPNPIRADHPIVFTHPVTGEPFLFLSRRHVDHVVGLTPAQSSALVEELSTYLYQPEHIYAHVWRPGDVVVWDNLALQHGRTDFDRKWRRHLRRIQIGP